MPLQVYCRNCSQYRHEWCNLKVDSPDPDMVRDCQYYRGMTNADRIRSMTDGELARLFADDNCGYCRIHDFCFAKGCQLDCEDMWLSWLASPEEVDNG